MRTLRNKLIVITATLAIAASAAFAAPRASNELNEGGQQVAQEVRKELVTLPFYGIFDNLAYQVEGNVVTLYGQVVQPSTRKDAERRVARINGVERVINKIEVLPLSSFDDSIRIRTYRTLFGTGGLDRYAMGANPSVHIIVKGGHVTLEGVVANEADSRLAYLKANSVSGVFSVTNNLRAERSDKKAY